MPIVLNGSTGITSPAIDLSSPLPVQEGGTGQSTVSGEIVETTKSQTLTNKTALGLRSTYNVSNLGSVTGSVNIDLSLVHEFVFTVSGNVNLSFSNSPAVGTSQVVYLRIANGAAFAIDFPVGTRFDNLTLPTLTASGVDLLGVKWDSITSSYMVFVIGLNVGAPA